MSSVIRRIIVGVLIVYVAFIAGFKVSDYIHLQDAKKDKLLQQRLEDAAANTKNPYTYPQEKDADRGISVEYTAGVLKKLSNGEALTGEENDLISYHKVQDSGYGLAITRFHEHDGGMGKATRRIWETADAGNNWNVLIEQIYQIGHYDFSYMDNVFLEAAFSTTAEKGCFNISEDRGHTYRSVPYEDVFPYDGAAYAQKVAENAEQKTITFQWIDLYTQEAVATVEYDLNMNVIQKIK